MSVFSDTRRPIAHSGHHGKAPANVRRTARALAGAGAVAAIALPAGALLPRVGAPILALALGMAIAPLVPSGLLGELAFISRNALQVAIVLLGATISLTQVLTVGASSLPVMLGSLAASLLTAAVIGRRLAVPRRLRVLVGVGTGICGASAIAAVSGVIEADAREIRYAISTIFAFNLAAVVLFPMLGHLFGMGSHQFGLWSGTAINDTSSVLAAGFAYSHSAGTYGLIVKLTRTTMIIPISLWLATAMVRRRPGAVTDDGRPGTPPPARTQLRRIFPWFLLWFLAATAVDSLGLIGRGARGDLSHLGLGLTTVALAAVGLSSNLSELRQTGIRPLVLGAVVWGAVAATSLTLQVAAGA